MGRMAAGTGLRLYFPHVASRHPLVMRVVHSRPSNRLHGTGVPHLKEDGPRFAA